MKTKRLAASALLVALVTGEVSTAQSGRAVIVVRPAGYPGNDYTARPADETDWVFFVGEPIDLVVEIQNRGDGTETLRSDAGALAGLRWSAQRENETVTVAVGSTKVIRRSATGVDELRGTEGGEIVLQSRDTLEMSVQVSGTSAMAPGRYALTAIPDLTDTKGEPPAPQAQTFRFELRAQSRADELEILRRTAGGYFREARYDELRVTAERMLNLEPSSVHAYRLLGEAAMRSGNRAGAIAALETAERLVVARQDPRLSARYLAQFQWDHLLEQVRGELGAARAK
jgi:hypothetical protein